MGAKNNIIEAIRELAKNDDEVYSVVCTVKSVDTANKLCDCTPVNGNSDILKVRLMAKNLEGFLLIPKVDSTVIVTMTNKYTGYVAMCSEVSEIQLNGSNYDGLVKIGDLVTKLNNLENKVNDLINSYTAHTHPATLAVSGASATGTTNPSVIVPPITTLITTQQTDLENTTVKQGNG